MPKPAVRSEARVRGAANLEFPTDRDFVSLPPRIEPQAMLARVAETMPWRSMRPGAEQARLATKVDVEFTL